MKIAKVYLRRFTTELHRDMVSVYEPHYGSLKSFRETLRKKGWFVDDGVLITVVSKEIKSSRGSKDDAKLRSRSLPKHGIES